MRKRRPATIQISRRAKARAGFAALVLFAACDVYNQDLIDSALGDAEDISGGRGGTQTEGGAGGNPSGGGGSVTGGASGTGPSGGMSSGGTSSGGTSSGGTSSGGDAGDGGEGDTSSGGGSGGQGGSSTGGSGGESGSAGSSAQGGMTGGSGGAGNAGGSIAGGGAGGAGAGGAGAGMGGAGMGGAGMGGGGAGTGGGEVCSGCARLSVPLAATGDKAHFTIGLPAVTDFRTATITFRVSRFAGSGGWFKGYIQEGSPNFLYQDSPQTTIASIGTSMQTITWDIATAGTTADKSIVSRIGIEISGNGASAWTSPTVIYVDSITVTGTTLTTSSFTFGTASTVYASPTSSGPNDVIWLNNYSGDTNVTGAAVSWLGP